MYLFQIKNSNTYAAADDYIARPLASDLTFTVLVDDVIYLSLVFRLPWGVSSTSFHLSFSSSFTFYSSSFLALFANKLATHMIIQLNECYILVNLSFCMT